MTETIKCACSHCGAKYRLPQESQGRVARCKRCGEKFEVPRLEQSLEDTIMTWLSSPEDEDTEVARPRVINMSPTSDADAAKRARGPIRMKGPEAEEEAEAKEKAK